jgi:Cu(I)/Ag(I) efflux system membrane fusion protein
VELANPDLALRPGMHATLEFESPGIVTLSIPRAAALVTGKRTLVFLKRPDGRFEPREVTLGAATDERYEVLAGLAVGDTVVASGTFLLDAESNLGTMLGGMGGMPGMDMGPPPPPVTHKHE